MGGLPVCNSEDMTDYPKNLQIEGAVVLQTRRYSGSPLLNDDVDPVLYHKWILNCISFLKVDAPDHVLEIKAIYKPDYSFYYQAEKIFGIVQSAVEYVEARREPLTREAVTRKAPEAFALDFLHPKVVEKCADHFLAKKYDDCILNATKVVEVAVRNAAHLPNSDVGVNLMRKAFKVDNPILKYSDTPAEQESVMNLFSGFIGVFKNPHSHRFLEIKDPLTAFEILSFANHLLGLVENLKERNTL